MGLRNGDVALLPTKLYPSNEQKLLLGNMFESHRKLYNALLEQRIYAWKGKQKSLFYEEQCKEITQLRKDFEEYKKINAQSLQETAKRLDKAYKTFFSRVKEGQSGGFPRFKSSNRFSGWGYKTHGDGWKIDTSKAKKVTKKQKSRGGIVKISGVGKIRIRGMSRNDGTPKTMEVLKKGEDWFISVTYKCSPERKAGEHTHAFDWGIENFLTIANEQEQINTVENPRFLKTASEKIEKLQKDLSRKKLKSNNRKKVKVCLARCHKKIANKRLDFMHKTSCKIVENSKRLITEKLTIKNMTKAPKAKKDEISGLYLPSGAARKAGLNKSILDTSPSQFLQMVRVKAEEAAYELEEIETKKLKPSQRCAMCANVVKKELSERLHSCLCGFSISRDANSALVMLKYALGFLKIDDKPETRCRGPALCVEAPSGALKHEAPTAWVSMPYTVQLGVDHLML
jgi:putative transposase